MNEWWYFDFLRLTVMNCNELYFDVHYIVIEYLLLFVFVSISILTLLQNYRNPWFFLQSLPFEKNAHRKKVGETNGHAEEQPRRWFSRSHVAARGGQDLRIRSYDHMACKCSSWSAVRFCDVFIYIRENWKTSIYSLINYCQTRL